MRKAVPCRSTNPTVRRDPRCCSSLSLLLVGLAVIIGGGGCGPRPSELPLVAPVQSFEGEWEYRYGNSPMLPDGSLEWVAPAHDDGGWRAVSNLARPPGRKGAHTLWLRTPLPSPEIPDALFYIRTIDQNYEAYVDGQLVSRVGAVPEPGWFLGGAPTALIRLPAGYAGKRLVMRVYSPSRSIGLARDRLIGGRAELLVHLLRSGLDELFIGGLMFVLGVAVFIIYLSRPNDSLYLHYSAIAMSIGVYCISRCHAKVFLFENYQFWWVVQLASLCLIGYGVLTFFNTLFGEGPLKLGRLLAFLFPAFLVGSLGAVGLGAADLLAPLFPIQMLILAMLVYVSGIAIQSSIAGNTDGRIIAVGWLLSAALSSFDLLTNVLRVSHYVVLSHVSALVFSLSLGIVLVRRFLEMSRRLRDYGAMLHISLASTNALDPRQHALQALEEVRRLWQADRALLFLCESGSASGSFPVGGADSGEGNALELAAACDARGSQRSTDEKYDQGLVGEVRLQQRALSGRVSRSDGEHSVLAAPLVAQRQFLGVLYIEAGPRRRAFDRADLELLFALTGQLAVSVLTARALRLELETALTTRRLAQQGALLAEAERMARGDLETPITVPPGSELEPLAQALDGMRNEVRSQITRLTSKNREVEDLNEELRRQIDQRSRRVLELALRSTEQKAKRAAFEPGDLLGEAYRVVRLIGQGAAGSVYEVVRLEDERHLAAKVLTPRADQAAMVRFAREAQILARLHHPSLISIIDIDVLPSGVPFLVMELVLGKSLKLCREHYGRLGFVLPVLRKIAEGLAAIHDSGIVHRDLKPANVLIADAPPEGSPVVKLVDFGISTEAPGKRSSQSGDRGSQRDRPSQLGERSGRSGERPRKELPLLPGEAGAVAGVAAGSPAGSSESWAAIGVPPGVLISSGGALGTPMYLAPEALVRSVVVGPQADVFSFGVLAYELLFGELPFAEPPAQLVAQHDALKPPVFPSRPLSATAMAVLGACLAKDPDERPTAARLVEIFQTEVPASAADVG